MSLLNVRSLLALGAVLPVLAAGQPAPAPAREGKAPGAEEANGPKVRTLEERVSDLKEKIFRSKARLTNLQELAVGGDVSTGAKAVLVHRNEMGSSFYLESVAYALDGAPIYTKVDVGADLAGREELEIFNGRIVPGSHQLSVQLVYRGHGHGLFSYVDGYRFKVRSSYTFGAEAGEVNTIRVVAFEKGGLTAGLEERPAVRYDVDVRREVARREAGALAPTAAEGPRK